MAYGVVHYFPGGTRQQYEAALAAVHPGADQLPDGQIYHHAGPGDGGWVVVAIHESRQSWENFRDNVLMPKLKQGIPGAFTEPPQERTFEVFRNLP